MRFFLSASLVLVATMSATAPALAAGPEEFTPVDTERLLGSPDPLPLRLVPAFPELPLERPVELADPNDGTQRLFVAEQRGVIQVFENRRDVSESATFLDLQDVVSRKGNEEGLLGLAFHPDYKNNSEFFVYYSVDPPESVISRFRVSKDDPNRADRDSEEVLLRIEQPFRNHNGGSIQFGPDGFLYIGMGDGGAAHDPHANGQDLSTLLGSILRIDVDSSGNDRPYGIPSDNPFVDRDDARPEIYAYGLRNVWRLGFDSKTGELWCGDVGQERYEEIDIVVAGGNYGWDIKEGLHPFSPQKNPTDKKLIDPVAEHFHSEGESITGGLVYRGQRLPEWEGCYVFGDYVSGFLWALRPTSDDRTEFTKQKIADTGMAIAAFAEDRDGELYVCTFENGIQKLANREGDLQAEAEAFPRTLSETGLFASVADHEMTPGVYPYDVNIPFWSDGAVKQRFIALPRNHSVTYSQKEKWEFPVGTVFVKTFYLPLDETAVSESDLRQPEHSEKLHRLETRLFVHGHEGWAGYTYIWNDEQTDAELIDDAQTETFNVTTEDGPRGHQWYYPSRVDCMACHAKAVKFVLGWNTRQLNRSIDYGDGSENQLAVFERLGLFENVTEINEQQAESYPDWRVIEDQKPEAFEKPQLTAAARGWLDVNCVMCHSANGIAVNVSGQPIDLWYHTPLEKTGIVGRKPGQGQLTSEQGRVVAPGEPTHSELFRRATFRGPRQMPPLATLYVDEHAAEILKAWIEQLAE